MRRPTSSVRTASRICGEPRQQRSDFPYSSSDDPSTGGNIKAFPLDRSASSPRFHFKRHRRVWELPADTPIIWAVSRPLSSTSTGGCAKAVCIFGVRGKPGLPLLFGPTQVGVLAEWRQREYRPDCLEPVQVSCPSTNCLRSSKERPQRLKRLPLSGRRPASCSGCGGSPTSRSQSPDNDSVSRSVLTLTNRWQRRSVDASK